MITLFHSIVRFVPDIVREEFLNVGVVVVAPKEGWADFRTYALVKVRTERMGAEYRQKEFAVLENILSEFQAEWKQRLPMIEELGAAERLLQEYSRRTASDRYQLTPFLSTEVDDDKNAVLHGRELLGDLFDRVVLPPSRQADIDAEETKSQSTRELFETSLQRYNLLATEKRRGVRKNYHLDESPELFKFEFGFRNGAIHVFETLDLTDPEHRGERLFQAAGGKLIKFAQAQEALKGRGMKLSSHTLLHGGRGDMEFMKPSVELLREYSRVFSIDDNDELMTLLNRIRNALRPGLQSEGTPQDS